MKSKLIEVVEEHLDEYKNLRKITVSTLVDLGYHKSNLSLQIDAYPEGKEGKRVRFGLYSIVREHTEKPAKFSFIAPIVDGVEDQEGAIIAKPFTYFERLV